MIIEARVRPKYLKRGVSMKKFCQALGFKEEVGLSQLCCHFALSGESGPEFGFLTNLYRAFQPAKNQSTRVVIEIDGKAVCQYTQNSVSAMEQKEGE